MRVWIIALIALACGIGGCAGKTSTGAVSSASRTQSLLERAPSMEDDEATDFLAEAAARKLDAICGSRQTSVSQISCLREALLRGFDGTGEAAKNCHPDAAIRPMLKCIITGTVGYELALHESLDIAAAYDWEDGQASLKTTARQLTGKVLNDCASARIDGIDACLLPRLGQAFSLPEGQTTICTVPADLDRSVDCLLRSFLILRIGGGIEKMSVEDGVKI